MNNKKILFIIVVVGFFLRFINVSNNSPSLYWDEVSIGYEAYSIAQTGKDMHGNHWLQPIFPAYGDYKAPVYIWLTALATTVLGPTNLSVRLPSVILGTATILTLYFLTKELFPKQKHLSLISAFLLAISPWHLQFSRAGFEANIGLFFISLSLLLLFKARQQGCLAVIAALTAALGVYSYFSVRIVFPLIALAVLIIFWRQFKSRLPWLVVAAIVFTLALLPLFKSPFYFSSNQFRLSTKNILDNKDQIYYANLLRFQDNNTLVARLIHHRYTYTAKELIKNINDHLTFSYFFLTGDPNPRHGTNITGIILPSFAPFFFIGLYQGWRKHKRIFIFLLAWWLIALLPASVPEETPHALRSLNALPAVSIILGLGTAELFNWSKSNRFKKILVTCYLLLVTANFVGYLHYYHHHYPLLTNRDWQDGYRQLAQYLKTQEDNFNYLAITDLDRLYLYILFYTQYPPAKLHQELSQSQGKYAFIPNQFGKYTFKRFVWDWERDNFTLGTLMVGSPSELITDFPIKTTITDSNNNPVFLIIDTQDL